MNPMGIDVGGSGIKGAPVDLEAGELAARRKRIITPQPATPDAVIAVIDEIRRHFDYSGPLGVGFPAAILGGVVKTAANVHDSWIDYPAAKKIAQVCGGPVTLVNDADAAGLAEMRYGAGKGRNGVVMIITLGTGIGTSLFVDGKLVPNTELGHIYLRRQRYDAEYNASDRARVKEKLGWKAWAGRLDEYLSHICGLFWPDLIILGGGVSKKHEKFVPYLTVPVEIVPAQLLNEAGIVGAALACEVGSG